MSVPNQSILRVAGAILRNGGTGGWAAFLMRENVETFATGAEELTDLPRLELLALRAGLQMVPEGSRIRVISASRYVIDGGSTWRFKWAERGFRNLTNSDIWRDIHRLATLHTIDWRWATSRWKSKAQDDLTSRAKQAAHEMEACRSRRGNVPSAQIGATH